MGDQVFSLERSWYIGNALFAIFYGIQLSMWIQSVYYLSAGPGSFRRKLFYIAYGGVLLVLITISTAANLFYGEAMWIEHRDVPGGPAAYFSENEALWYNTLGTATDVTANVLGDGLMLHRCYIIWDSNPWVILFPGIVYLGSVSMAIVTTIQSGVPGGDFFSGVTVNFGVPWVALTLTFNVLVTAMISTRLLLMQKKVRAVLGPEHTKLYTGVVAILVESALPFTLLSIAYIIPYARNDVESLALVGIWGCFFSLSPQAIILRVAMGAAWSKDTMTRVTGSGPLVFAEMPGAREKDSHGSSTNVGESTTRLGLQAKPSSNSISKVV